MKEHQKEQFAVCIQEGWRRYRELLGEDPHGTLRQIRALVDLMPLHQLQDVSAPKKEGVER